MKKKPAASKARKKLTVYLDPQDYTALRVKAASEDKSAARKAEEVLLAVIGRAKKAGR